MMSISDAVSLPLLGHNRFTSRPTIPFISESDITYGSGRLGVIPQNSQSAGSGRGEPDASVVSRVTAEPCREDDDRVHWSDINHFPRQHAGCFN